MASADPPGTHPLPLSTRVVQLQHTLTFNRDPIVTIERDELVAILSRYTAMSHALVRALHELERAPRD